jgi:PAS domain S-box-containing protein
VRNLESKLLSEIGYLNNIDNIIAVYEPRFNYETNVYNFDIKFFNECFIKEFNSRDLIDNNVRIISEYLKKSFGDCLVKFEEGFKTITTNLPINDKSYKINICRFGDKYILCTLYKSEDILINKEVHWTNSCFIENSMEIIFIVGEDGKILHANKKAVEAYGYTNDEFLNLSVFDIRNQDVRNLTKKQLDQALKRGIQFKTYHYKKDGSRFPVEVRSIRCSEKCKDTVVSIVRDLTDIEEIFNDATVFSVSLDIFDEPFIVFTKDMNISHWSIGAEEKFGFKREEIIGKNLDELVPKDKLDESERLFNMVKSGNVIKNFETIRLDKYGNILEVLVSISSVFDMDGMFSGVVAIYKDISEKKELIKKLREHEERWRYALETGHFGVWDWDIKNNRVFYSNFFKIMLGYKEEEISDSFEEWTSRVHPDDIEYFMGELQKHFQGKEYIMEFRMKCKDNSYKWIKSRSQIVYWTEGGNPQRMIGTVEDITDRKLMEHRLKEKYNQLKILKEEADNANKAKTQFLANMSHEIRTPMNGIMATIQLLQLGDLNEGQHKYTKMLKESADNLLNIINNLLDISKIESGKFTLNNELFNLKETINNIYNYLLITGNSKGLEVSFYLDSNIDSEVVGDELRLKEILSNLISNAIKFTDEGYVSFRVKLLESNDNAQRIEFRVKDSGIGIEEDYKEKIFNNFSQGDISTRKKYKGTGLGLAISKQLAELMQGDISFESNIGEGSTFIFTCEFKRVKTKDNNGIQKKSIKDKKEYNNRKIDKTILCIEDNIINQEVIENIIANKGYRYLSAYNGKEALESLKNNKIDLILMDIQLPELNGFETTKIIRCGEENIRNIPIIAMTAYAMREDRDKCIRAGMNDYISKPFDLENFYDILGSYLGT